MSKTGHFFLKGTTEVLWVIFFLVGRSRAKTVFPIRRARDRSNRRKSSPKWGRALFFNNPILKEAADVLRGEEDEEADQQHHKRNNQSLHRLRLEATTGNHLPKCQTDVTSI